MKKIISISIVILSLLLNIPLNAQTENDTVPNRYRVTQQDGIEIIGKIITQDAREVLMETDNLGQVIIPKYVIESIEPVGEDEIVESGGLFATRYFLTTNAFSIKKGENYVQWNLFGPDFQFGVADNFTLGIMTSWVGTPIVGTAKYSFKLNEGFYAGVGALVGTGSWAALEYGGLVPFAFLSAGNRVNNINFSAGYGMIYSPNEPSLIPSMDAYSTNRIIYTNRTDGYFLFSLAGMFRINDKFSFVFDSFILPNSRQRERTQVDYDYNETTQMGSYSLSTRRESGSSLVVLVPGIRFQANRKSSFQFGFTGINFDGDFVPAPIPLIQWFRKI